MERPQHLKAKLYEIPAGRQLTLIIIIILFHMVGIIGLSIPSLRSIFLTLVPWHILLMLAVIIVSHKPFTEEFTGFALIVYLTGFMGEWLGVHKNWVFGNYNYGQTLGLKLFDIPITMGVNWFLLIYAAGVLLQRSRVKSKWIRIIAGALILVLLDLLIEPVAMKFDYWHWAGNIIPLKNYAGWFLVSAVMLWLFEQFNFKKQSIVAPVLLVTQFLFFALLHFL